MLFFAAFFWGSTFVAQSDAAAKVPPFTYLAARSYVGVLSLGLALLLRRLFFVHAKEKRAPTPNTGKRGGVRATLVGGVVCGTVLTVASALQQYGIHKGATAGEAGFLTAIYMFFVPLLNFIFRRIRVEAKVLFGAGITAVGLYFLCVADKGWSAVGVGQALVLLCAVAYAFHILSVDFFGSVDGMELSCVQFAVCALISTVAALIFERFSVSDVLSAWVPIVYAGVFSSAVAFTLQIYGQKYTPAAAASVLMGLESVIALLCEWACAFIGLVGQPFSLSGWQISGCVLAFFGIVLAQWEFKKKTGETNKKTFKGICGNLFWKNSSKR